MLFSSRSHRGSWSLLLVLVACSGRINDDRCTLVVANPKTGEHAAIGREITRARLLVEEEIGGAAGTVRFREIDTSSTPAVARAEVSRAISKWKTPLIIGSIISGETREFLPLALETGVNVLANGASDPGIRTLPYREARDGFFRNWPSDDFEGRAMADYVLSTNRASALVVLHADDPYAAALAGAFSKSFSAKGGTILGKEVYPLDLSSFEQLVRRQPVDGHDGYYVIGFPPDVAAIYNTVRRLPETMALPIFSAAGANTDEFFKLATPPVDNLFVTAPDVTKSSGPYFEFRKDYLARFDGDEPDIVTATTYDALKIGWKAVAERGCDAEAIRDYLHGEEVFEGTTGPTAFDEMGDVFTKPVVVYNYQDGRRLTAG